MHLTQSDFGSCKLAPVVKNKKLKTTKAPRKRVQKEKVAPKKPRKPRKPRVKVKTAPK